MKFNWHRVVLLLAVLVGFASCEVEFDPNEKWKPTTVVYGILDQDDDTTFVRVQKGFLGSGNYLEFACQRDSIYYPQDEIEVFMLAFYPWERDIIRDTFWFEYTENYPKREGEFYNENAPIYYCVTKGRLSGEETVKMEYKLVVRNLSTQEEISASTRLIGNYDITSPSPNMYFVPKGNRHIMECKWYTINSFNQANHQGIAAKMYQPVMRFYYRLDGNETYIDVELSTKLNTRGNVSSEFSYVFDMYDIVNGIKVKLKDQKDRVAWTNRLHAFELYINSCTLEMYEYYSNSLQSGNTLSDKPVYTNISGGYGLFASRRRNIKLTFTTDDEKLLREISALGYGF